MNKEIYNKKDIMALLGCESDKALRLLKLLFSIDKANKIGKEYYVKKEDLYSFFDDMKGKDVQI